MLLIFLSYVFHKNIIFCSKIHFGTILEKLLTMISYEEVLFFNKTRIILFMKCYFIYLFLIIKLTLNSFSEVFWNPENPLYKTGPMMILLGGGGADISSGKIFLGPRT